MMPFLPIEATVRRGSADPSRCRWEDGFVDARVRLLGWIKMLVERVWCICGADRVGCFAGGVEGACGVVHGTGDVHMLGSGVGTCAHADLLLCDTSRLAVQPRGMRVMLQSRITNILFVIQVSCSLLLLLHSFQLNYFSGMVDGNYGAKNAITTFPRVDARYVLTPLHTHGS